MRLNVYHEELTHEAAIVWTEPRPGVRYAGLRIYQRSAPELHDTEKDDDRSAVTFWVGSVREARRFVDALSAVVSHAEMAASDPTTMDQRGPFGFNKI